jgi:hypothetical protein
VDFGARLLRRLSSRVGAEATNLLTEANELSAQLAIGVARLDRRGLPSTYGVIEDSRAACLLRIKVPVSEALAV